MYIRLPRSNAELFQLAENVLAKHTADGINSPLTPFVDMVALSARLNLARMMQAQHAALFVQAKQETETRNAMLGKGASDTTTTAGTLLYEVYKALNIVQAIYRHSPSNWGSWGFDVRTSPYRIWKNAANKRLQKHTTGAVAYTVKSSRRVRIPQKPLYLIKLAKAIVAKHLADGANSPLTGIVDTALLATNAQSAETAHHNSIQLHRAATTARAARDIAIWGHNTQQTTHISGSLTSELTKAKNVLMVVHRDNLHKLGDWGFTVRATARHSSKNTIK